MTSSSRRSDEPQRKEPELVVYETLSQLLRDNGQFQVDHFLDRQLEEFEKLNDITKTRRKEKNQEEEEESEKKAKPARNPKSG